MIKLMVFCPEIYCSLEHLRRLGKKNAGDLSRDSWRTGEKLYTPPKYNRKCLGCSFPFMGTEAFIEQF